MKPILFLAVFFFFACNNPQSNSNLKENEKLSENENLNRQLVEMKNLFLAENFKAYCHYIYPPIIKMMGSEEKLISALQSALNEMKNDGFETIDIHYSEPSKMIKQGNELQMTITQNLLMKSPQGNVLGKYTLIAISEDEGKNWKFIDTSGKDLETMRSYFPNLSPQLVIKPKEQKILD